MDIEDRAEKWADEHTCCDNEWRIAVAAYLAGAAQAQGDYVTHYSRDHLNGS